MKRLASYLLVFALILSMIPGAFAAGNAEEEQQIPTQIGLTAAEAADYIVKFDVKNATIDVYYTQDYS